MPRCIKGEPDIEEYYEWYLEAEKYSNQITETVLQSSVSQPFLMPGRLVVVKSQSVSCFLLITLFNHTIVLAIVFVIIISIT